MPYFKGDYKEKSQPGQQWSKHCDIEFSDCWTRELNKELIFSRDWPWSANRDGPTAYNRSLCWARTTKIRQHRTLQPPLHSQWSAPRLKAKFPSIHLHPEKWSETFGTFKGLTSTKPFRSTIEICINLIGLQMIRIERQPFDKVSGQNIACAASEWWVNWSSVIRFPPFSNAFDGPVIAKPDMQYN